jgi:hypothetical protein
MNPGRLEGSAPAAWASPAVWCWTSSPGTTTRPFANQWDFVDYVQQQEPGLDLTTPPARSRMLS